MVAYRVHNRAAPRIRNAAARPALERLRAVPAAVPHRAGQAPQFWARGGRDRAQARRQLAQAVHSAFTADRAVLRTAWQRLQDAAPGTVNEGTMTERLTAYKRIKERAQIYADLLGMQQERIQAAIAALTEQARAVVLAEPAPEPAGPPRRQG